MTNMSILCREKKNLVVMTAGIVLLLIKFQSVITIRVKESSQIGGEDIQSDNIESEYDDSDVQFDESLPNVLILLADPANNLSTIPLANLPNTEVLLEKNLNKVHLFCSAYYPIKWSYEGDGFPFMSTDYTRFVEDFYDPSTYAFSALLELQGLEESQTGNYTCRKWNDEAFSSSFYLYVPGEEGFLVANVNQTIIQVQPNSQVKLPCSVSDPTANVTLYKKSDKEDNIDTWIQVDSDSYTYSRKYGFLLQINDAVNEVYRCQILGTNISRYFKVQLTTSGENSTLSSQRNQKHDLCCDKMFLTSLGTERTSCRGYISTSCQTPHYLGTNTPCTDWKISEFLHTPIELCKREISKKAPSTGVGYYTIQSSSEIDTKVIGYCRADPEEFTQGFKLGVQWQNGSIQFIEEGEYTIPSYSDYPAGYEINVDMTSLIVPVDTSLKVVTIQCYLPLKFSYKWIKVDRSLSRNEIEKILQSKREEVSKELLNSIEELKELGGGGADGFEERRSSTSSSTTRTTFSISIENNDLTSNDVSSLHKNKVLNLIGALMILLCRRKI